MTASIRSLPLWFACAAAFATGCASERDNRVGMLKGRDPLMGEKIPPPNVPTGRDTYGIKDTRDPLIRADAGRSSTRDTAAGLAGGSRDEGISDLRIPNDRRAGGGITSRDAGGVTPTDQITSEVKRMGGKVFAAKETSSGYEVRVQIPAGDSGAMTGFIGSGSTATAALRDAFDQVRAAKR
jgi:hypothetical protein